MIKDWIMIMEHSRELTLEEYFGKPAISFGLPDSIPFCSGKYSSGTKYRRKFTLECIPDNCHLNHKKRCIGHVFSFSSFCNWKSFDISINLSSSSKV